ncbi:prenyltransferase/squalene oxidase repeat-containing protein [uncultured Gimesia sp.]|uniref:prenyltransferase/squalene oxidase repeat-containing protein n=1 Tax=uncultured Gimesia sp. TaxID=1678688 RepID=UPI0030DC1062|tara:strand:- start:51061 stop:53304 length:2244 start_codon:yes stop_codon:yes gene_type:complete
MSDRIHNLIERTLSGRDISFDQILWGILILAAIFASIHLLSMLVTRWGDSNASSKALLFSIIVHLSLSLGVVTFWPDYGPQSLAKTQPDQDNIEIKQILAESTETIKNKQTGNSPVWEQLSTPEKQELSRIDLTRPEFSPLMAPPEKERPQEISEMPLPDVVSKTDLPITPAKVNVKSVSPKRIQSQAPLEISDVTAESRAEASVPSTSNIRSKMVRTGQTNQKIERQSSPGAVDRIQPTFSNEQKTLALNAQSDPKSTLKRNATENMLRKRTGPAPSNLELETTGVESATPSEASANVSPTEPRFTRRRSRTMRSVSEGTIQRSAPQSPAGKANPNSERLLADRSSLPLTINREGLRPDASRPNFNAVSNRTKANIPATYRLRNLSKRKEIAQKFGGTEESERAVEASLKWLATHQEQAGFWDANRYGAGKVRIDEQGIDRRSAGAQADAGLTALSILAFLGAGYTQEEGQYSDNLNRAIQWMVNQQRPNGFLGGEATHYARMYSHAMATYSLAEAYGLQNDPKSNPKLREAIARAISYIVENQNPYDGGWRYVKGQKSDMSMFGWQLMALKSAEIAGIPIPSDTKQLMVKFLKERSLGKNSGLATYRMVEPSTPPTRAMTAESLFCKQMLGIRRDNPSCTEAIQFISERPPRRSEYNLYYWYYGTLAMYQYGGNPWREWNEDLRELLISEQVMHGSNAGSWDPRPPWGPYGGRLYSTTLSTLCLEVYYRFLPLYQMGGRYDDASQ